MKAGEPINYPTIEKWTEVGDQVRSGLLEPMTALAHAMESLCDLRKSLPADHWEIPTSEGGTVIAEPLVKSKCGERVSDLIEQTHAELMAMSRLARTVPARIEIKP